MNDMHRNLIIACFGLAALSSPRAAGQAPRGADPVVVEPREKIVFVRSKDEVVSGGVSFSRPKGPSKPVAIIWVHGWGTNFYLPSYVKIGRSLAERGLTSFSVNTRLHDIGNVVKYSRGRRIRGGGYWGIPKEAAHDIAAWIDFAEQAGFSKVVLAGHSAGWMSVGAYQAESRDQRVVGVVFASGMIGGAAQAVDQELLAQAKKLVADGAGDDLLRLPNRSFPSFLSAATFLENASAPGEYLDFFGTRTPNAAIARIACPLLAFFGSKDDVGGERELDLLKSSAQRLPKGPRAIDTTVIVNGNHEYVGEETQVARVISNWVDTVVLK